MICVSRPPKEWPITTGFFLSLPIDLAVVVGDLADGLVREDLGVLLGLLDRRGVVGPAGRERRVARLLEDRRPSDPSWRGGARGRG